MLKLRMIFTALVIVLSGLLANAQSTELLERVFEGTSKSTSPQGARQDIQDQAFQKASEDVIKELIGEERYAKNKSLIADKIIKNSARYIPFVKPSAPIQDGETTKMSVTMKISLRDLKTLLQNNSLLSDNETMPVVLPMIAWIDRVEGRSFRWWQSLDKESQGFLTGQARSFEESLREAFQNKDFFLVKPQQSGLAHQVPVDFQHEKLNSEDTQFFSHYFNAPVLIDGQVVLSKADVGYRVEVKMTALQVSNGRAIADVSRRFETSRGVFESVVDKKIREIADSAASDLASQVYEAWQRGTIGSNVIRVTIQGRSTLQDLESLKSLVKSQLSQVKSIRERILSSEKASFEVDTSVSSEELASKLESLQIQNRKLGKISADAEEIVMKWK